jgi:hypothetical protein
MKTLAKGGRIWARLPAGILLCHQIQTYSHPINTRNSLEAKWSERVADESPTSIGTVKNAEDGVHIPTNRHSTVVRPRGKSAVIMKDTTIII